MSLTTDIQGLGFEEFTGVVENLLEHRKNNQRLEEALMAPENVQRTLIVLRMKQTLNGTRLAREKALHQGRCANLRRQIVTADNKDKRRNLQADLQREEAKYATERARIIGFGAHLVSVIAKAKSMVEPDPKISLIAEERDLLAHKLCTLHGAIAHHRDSVQDDEEPVQADLELWQNIEA